MARDEAAGMKLEHSCITRGLTSCYSMHALEAKAQEGRVKADSRKFCSCLSASQTNGVYTCGGTIQ